MPHNPLQRPVGLVLPADPAVPLRQVAGGEVVQQAAQQAPLTVFEEVAQVGADGLAIAQWMVACEEFVPQGGLIAAADEPQAQRLELWQGAVERGLGRTAVAQREGAPWRPRPGPWRAGRARSESRSSSSSRRSASWMRLLPRGVCHRRCSQTVRLSRGKLVTISWMSAIWLRRRRWPQKAVEASRTMRGSSAAAERARIEAMRKPGAAETGVEGLFSLSWMTQGG